MNPALEEIDALYRSILSYHAHLYLSHEDALKFYQDADEAFWMGRDKANRTHRTASDKFLLLAPTLSLQEIIEGFEQGCVLLQANLGGQMCLHFDEAYIPTMLQAIKDDHYGGYLFLGKLSRHFGKEITPLLIGALDSKLRRRTRETAIGFIHELEIVEAIPKLKELTNDLDTGIAEFAQKTLKFLGNSQQ